VAGLALPFFAPTDVTALRALVGNGAAWVLLRTLDLARDPTGLSPARRVFHVVALYDTRLTTRAPPAFSLARHAAVAGWLLLALGALWLATHAAGAPRWLAGAAAVYAGFEALAGALVAGSALCGVVVPTLHDAPIRSRSVAEFWGRRWNRIVSAWLREYCFEPLARRGRPGLGVAAAFAASALLHAYFTRVALDFTMAAAMGGFFLLQIPLCAAERALGVDRWPAAAARVWTVAALLGTSPLFVEPLLRMFDPLVGR
jgi:hypothetical protein